MLNPERLTMRRSAGVRSQRSISGVVSGAVLTDDPLIYTGGGATELLLDLMFDVGLAGSSIATEDVRDLTGPLWSLAENIPDRDGYGRVPLVRFVWGKSWNVPGVVAAVAERLEHFTAEGAPTRSWLRMRFLRVAETTETTVLEQPPLRHEEVIAALPESGITTSPATAAATPPENEVHQYAANERLDDLATRYFRHPSMWRLLAGFNDLLDPLRIAPGTLLRVPELKTEPFKK
jgi:hypothetical protein